MLFINYDNSFYPLSHFLEQQSFTLSQVDSEFFHPPPPPDIKYMRFDTGVRPFEIEYAGVGADNPIRKKKKLFLRKQDINKFIHSQRALSDKD